MTSSVAGSLAAAGTATQAAIRAAARNPGFGIIMIDALSLKYVI
jgi:hypothetical protein